jgi:3D (Asp-Asp-Asp) domain-containing protein
MNKIKDWLKRDFQRTNKTVCYFLSLVGFALCIYFWVNIGFEMPKTNNVVKFNLGQIQKPSEVVEGGVRLEITAFSSECGSKWCLANLGKGRDTNNDGLNDVALNSKFGKVSKIYIPAYDKFYSVIQGAPATGTDIDIWFDTDHEGATQFGRHNLLVNLIK